VYRFAAIRAEFHICTSLNLILIREEYGSYRPVSLCDNPDRRVPVLRETVIVIGGEHPVSRFHCFVISLFILSAHITPIALKVPAKALGYEFGKVLILGHQAVNSGGEGHLSGREFHESISLYHDWPPF
jgi:hypothetical protein